MAQKSYTVTAPSGKTYVIPWTESREITEKDIDDFIAKQESRSPFVKQVEEVAESPTPKRIGLGTMFESLLPENVRFNQPDRPYLPEELPSFPERAAREIGTDVMRGAASPAGIASSLVAGGMSLFPQTRRIIGSLIGRGTKAPAVVPKPTLPENIFPDLPTRPQVGTEIPTEFSAVDEIVLPAPITPAPNAVPQTPMQEVIKLNTSERPFRDLRDADLDTLANRGVRGALEERKLRQAALSSEQLTSAEITKQALANKPKYRLTDKINEVELINPNPENVKQAVVSGYRVIGVNPDKSIRLQKVPEITPPTSAGIPQFEKKTIQEVGDITKKPTIKLWHGSRLEPGKGAFGGIHAGTKRAALDRLENTPGERIGGIPGGEKLYPIEISPNKVYGPIDETELHSLINLKGKLDELRKQGYDAISYKNIVEDPGETSYLILDSKIAKVGKPEDVSKVFKGGEYRPEITIKLPKELSGAKPTFYYADTQYTPVFDSDLDKAAYIIGKAEKRSARDTDYLKFVMDNTGLNEAQARAYGRKVRVEIKRLIRQPGQGAGKVRVPYIGHEIPQTPPQATIPGVKVNKAGEIVEDTAEKAGEIKQPTKEGIVTTVGGTLKSLASGGEFSALFRQARPILDRPELWRNVPRMFTDALSEEGFQKSMAGITQKPHFERMREAGVSFTDLAEEFSNREEAIMSSLPERLRNFAPDNKLAAPLRQIGRFYRGSNRAYASLLNNARADLAETLMEQADKLGLKNTADADIARWVNNATGRGSLHGFEQSSKFLNATLFSPRLFTSRVNILLSPITYANANPIVRKAAMRSWLTLGATQTALASAGYLMGNDTAFDPRSANFGKIQIGKTRIDLGGSFNQIITAAARLQSGVLKSSTTGKEYDLRNPKFGGPTEMGVAAQFIRSKESPLLGLVSEIWTGKDFVGQPIEVKEAILRRVVPMFYSDLYDVIKEEKPEALPYVLALGAPTGLFGAGLQTYGPKTPKRKPGSVPRR